MKARTSYHDFVGSVEADISYPLTNRPGDPELTEALEKYGFDFKGAKVIGLQFLSGYKKSKNQIEIYLIMEADEVSKKLVKTEIILTVQEFFSLFQQLHIHLYEQYYEFEENLHIDKIKPITIKRKKVPVKRVAKKKK